MKIETALKKAGSVSALARAYGLKRQAVQGWMKNGWPEARIDELRKLRPEWFPRSRLTAPPT
jgi:transposase-like protein